MNRLENNIDALILAIYQQAVLDYRTALRKLDEIEWRKSKHRWYSETEYLKYKQDVQECEQFFLYGYLVSEKFDGKVIIDRIRKEEGLDC